MPLYNHSGEYQKNLATTKQVVNINSLQYLMHIPKGGLISSMVTNTYEGEINEIKSNSGVAGIIAYNKMIVLKGKFGKNYMPLTKEMLRSLEIEDTAGNLISTESLKPHDEVEVREYIDLEKKFGFMKAKIVIIRK